MKINPLTQLTLILTWLCFCPAVNAQNYCENSADSAQFFWIESVASGDFYHSAGPLQGFPNDQDLMYHGYLDYTDFTIPWQQGSNSLELTSGTVVIPDLEMHWQVWVDLNLDHVFSEDELLLSVSSFDDVVSETIDLSGLNLSDDLVTRMRVSMAFIMPAEPCGVFNMGEVEDYTVMIQAPPKSIWRVPEEYDTIQAAVDAANPGDKVLVNDGIYHEHVTVNKPLVLESVNGSAATLIAGTVANMHTIIVRAPDVTINGFEFTGVESSNNRRSGIFVSGGDNAKIINNRCGFTSSDRFQDKGIYVVLSDNVLIEGLICEAPSSEGIFISNSSNTKVINNYIATQKLRGISIDLSTDTEIRDNIVENNTYQGIYIKRATGALITGNVCSGSENQALPNQHIGIYILDYSEQISVINNQCHNNSGYGIHLYNVNDVEVIGNSTENNQEIGIYTFYSYDLLVSDNISAYNKKYGIQIWSSLNSQILANQTHDNLEQGLFLISIRHSQVSQNYSWNNPIEMNLDSSSYSVISKNIIEAGLEDDSMCQLKIRASDDNDIFLNSFLFNSNEICSSEISEYSHLQWYSTDDIEYIYQGELYTSQLGNYYLDGDHIDTNDDGVTDLPFELIEHYVNDPFPLADEANAYIIQ